MHHTKPHLMLFCLLIACIAAIPAAQGVEKEQAMRQAKKEKPPLGIPAFDDPAKEGIDPKLPNVLIIGDSISLGYTPLVAELLKGKANVFHSGGRWNENAGATAMSLGQIKNTGVRAIDAWCAFKDIKRRPEVVHPGYPKMSIHHPTIDYSAYGLKWDVITCNWGMWDISRGWGRGLSQEELAKLKPKDPSTPLPTYRERLTELFTALRTTDAQVFWVTTTPIDEGVLNGRLRRESDVIAYNAVAAEIAVKLGVGIIDLHSVVKPKIIPEWRRGGKLGNVHFSDPANAFLAKQMVEAITSALANPRDPPATDKQNAGTTADQK